MKRSSKGSRPSKGFTDEEKAAMKEYLQERQGVHPKVGADAEALVLEKIARDDGT